MRALYIKLCEKPLWVLVAGCLVTLFVLARLHITLGGHDYAYFLPRLLDNHLYYLANGFGLKEYTASFCAGIFEFANPQSVALSMPQLLASLFGPVIGIQLVFVIASAAAGAGLYGCARFVGFNRMPAMISALMMAFSGFLLTRMTVGHLTFFNVGFSPLIAMLMLYCVQAYEVKQLRLAITLGSLASLLATSIVYGGGGVMILQIAVMVALLLVLCGGFASPWHVWLRVFGSIVFVTLAMSAPKLEAMVAVTGNLSRDFYPLPGVGLVDLPVMVLQAVAWIPNPETLNDILQNRRFFLDWHEFNYSASPAWFLVVVVGFITGARAKVKYLTYTRAWISQSYIRTCFLFGLLSLPLILNLYTPSWNAVLKSTPVLGESSNLVRWFLIYLPALCLLAGWAWQHLDRIYIAPTLAFAIGLAAQQHYIHQDWLSSQQNAYDKSLITSPWTTGDIKPIFAVGAPIQTLEDGRRRPVVTSNFDHMFVDGKSNALCYEPMFGYRLEKFEGRNLRLNNINVPDQNGLLPMINPACYVYPQENACRVGASFTADQTSTLNTLTGYGDMEAKTSSLRSGLNLVAGVAFPITLLASFAFLWRGISRCADRDPSDKI